MNSQRIPNIISRLKRLAKSDITQPLVNYFQLEPGRAESMSTSAPNIFADFSKNLLSEGSFKKLIQLDKEIGLDQEIDAMFEGRLVNVSENRSALHTLLRVRKNNFSPYLKKKQSLHERAYRKMSIVVDELRQGQRKNVFGEPFTDIVNVGVGGSHLGPKLVLDSLRDYKTGPLNIHFLENADPSEIRRVFKNLPETTTLFIIASKSFGTSETLLNAQRAKEWLLAAGINEDDLGKHFLATTANVEAAKSFGVDNTNILPIFDWIGGRYSVWSCVGLPLALGVGMAVFSDFLEGAGEMDIHFRDTPTRQNLPKILALIGFWNNNCLEAESCAVVPYCDKFRFLPAYLQQLEMESNGKSVTKGGEPFDYHTAPVTWGGIGTSAQHAFFQLLYQGTRLIPVEFIVPLRDGEPDSPLHANQVANCFAQSETLMLGNLETESNPNKKLNGNKPSTTLLIDNLSPKAIGSLLSLYEHKTLTQGILWQINSFDQWGVEHGKGAAQIILEDFAERNYKRHDPSTSALMKKYLDTLDRHGKSS